MHILSAIVLFCFQSSSYGGILRTGNPLSWGIAKPVLSSVRLSGIKQFIFHYNRSKNIETPLFLWGDEIEYGLFGYDTKADRFDLSLRGQEIREQLSFYEESLTGLKSGCEWQPEYGSWMIEAVPRDPYGGYISDLLLVEKNMQLRRRRLHAVLKSNEIAPTSGNFPMLGVKGYPHADEKLGAVANSEYVSDKIINPHPRFGTLTKNIRARRGSNVGINIERGVDDISRLEREMEEASEYNCCDDVSVDIKENHRIDGERIERDVIEVVSETKGDEETIHMDAMAFGMGCCCLQITMQANDDRESRYVHDQLAVLAPMFLALSASTPIFKGQLAATDTRWDVISQSVDDRTLSERGGHLEEPDPDHELVAGGVKRLLKSRYSSVSRFIGKTESEEEEKNLNDLNDIDANIDEEALKLLLDGGVDRSLAAHIAHLFVRDPLVIFDDAIVLDDTQHMDHFENIQSTNWRTMRWKTPCLEMGLEEERRELESAKRIESERAKKPFSLKSDIDERRGGEGEGGGGEEGHHTDIQTFGPGWRVEFRPMEIQLTDFENAAFSLLTVLTTRSMLAMGYNFYLPVSLMEENMHRAERQNAVNSQKFWVRKESFSPSLTTVPAMGTSVTDAGNVRFSNGDAAHRCLIPRLDQITAIELTLDEFFNGRQGTAIDRVAGRQGEGFPGLIPAIYGYLEALGCDALMIGRLRPYLTLLQKRASGELPTAAQWMRTFVR
jgi:glutamate--cysteine ligase catalytic subunit